jgi:hypothetical protein
VAHVALSSSEVMETDRSKMFPSPGLGFDDYSTELLNQIGKGRIQPSRCNRDVASQAELNR